jgi:peptide/nickel transport system ATP-binding protein
MPPAGDRGLLGRGVAVTTPTYDVRNVSRHYGTRTHPVRALDEVSLSVAPGERLGIVGESGSGKSTLVRLMAALDRPTSGTIEFRGREIQGLPERELTFVRSDVQMVFQDPHSSLNPRMKVGDIVTEGLRSPRVDATAAADPALRRRRLLEVLDAVDLPPDSADRYPHEFSGGQRQRIAIARALAPNPSVLFADEPVSALDVSVRAQVLNLLNDLVERIGLTLIFVSHDLMVVRHLCETVLVLRGGRVVESGPTACVFDSPASDYTAQLVAAVPRFTIG